MYEEDIEHALKTRKYNAMRTDEREVINAIACDTTGTIKCWPSFCYSEDFITELQEQSIGVYEPTDSDDNWTFKLPSMN